MQSKGLTLPARVITTFMETRVSFSIEDSFLPKVDWLVFLSGTTRFISIMVVVLCDFDATESARLLRKRKTSFESVSIQRKVA